MILFTQTSACIVVDDRGYFVESSNDAIEVKKAFIGRCSSFDTIARTEYSLNYGGPEGTSLPHKNITISLQLWHPSFKNIVVFCGNLTVLYRNERLFPKNLRSFSGLSSASSVETFT